MSAPPQTRGSRLPFAEPAWFFDSLASPYYNASHRRLQAHVRDYIDAHILPHALAWEARGDCPDDAKRAWRDSGIPAASLLLGADIPPAYYYSNRPSTHEQHNAPAPALDRGPLGTLAGIVPLDELDAFHLLILTDETARLDGGVGVALSGGANVIGAPPVARLATEAQRRRWLPGLFTGEVAFCLGITEPTGGSDVGGGIRTTAVRSHSTCGDGSGSYYYTVNGTKKWITGAQWATHMTTAVRTGGPGAGGLSLLVVPLDAPGVEVEKIDNSGQNAGGASWVRMRDVRVPTENLLGEENAGFKYIMSNFNKERFVMAVICNRKARTCLSTALAYALERETFGRRLVSHQIIRHKLVTIAREVESHWAWLEQIAHHVQVHGWEQQTQTQQPEGDGDGDASSSSSIAGRIALAKVSGGRMLERAAREAQQIMGGVAYQRGGPGGGGTVEQITRDLRMMVVGGGSEEILEDLAFRQEAKAARRRGAKL